MRHTPGRELAVLQMGTRRRRDAGHLQATWCLAWRRHVALVLRCSRCLGIFLPGGGIVLAAVLSPVAISDVTHLGTSLGLARCTSDPALGVVLR
ncbi:hypothetical protein NDU88_003563 [Pleurodeles waltl]|uniref:DUF2085 domain-containing protein n=1 Tax=Pleurodeles waltl TaxID=8319 RepID=A0AAV7KZB9_PLEWA|nr:hypothetical protein NDU88_003563 [Pleurodeles waltl]